MTTAPPTPPPTAPLMASPALPAEVFQGAACYCTPWAETRRGKKEALARLQLIVAQFHFDEIDTSDLLIERNRAAVEVPIRYRHRETGALFESTKSNFWTLEDGWPVKLTHAIARIQAFASVVAGAHPA